MGLLRCKHCNGLFKKGSVKGSLKNHLKAVKANVNRKHTAKSPKKIKSSKKPQDEAIKTIKKYGSKEEFTLKFEVMKKFTKISKNKLQCQCCKVFFQPHFLNIDHIHGRKEILKEKPLIKIGYNERRSGKQLLAWIQKKIDEKIIFKHFQVLCWNCNIAKFLYKTCPHQRKS